METAESAAHQKRSEGTQANPSKNSHNPQKPQTIAPPPANASKPLAKESEKTHQHRNLKNARDASTAQGFRGRKTKKQPATKQGAQLSATALCFVETAAYLRPPPPGTNQPLFKPTDANGGVAKAPPPPIRFWRLLKSFRLPGRPPGFSHPGTATAQGHPFTPGPKAQGFRGFVAKETGVSRAERGGPKRPPRRVSPSPPQPPCLPTPPAPGLNRDCKNQVFRKPAIATKHYSRAQTVLKEKAGRRGPGRRDAAPHRASF